ncbi:MAG TPA: hypothetical protein VJZ71_17305 [Phycisphaerae bacterium]|nr:hypothetical protein [Phycisphaerae bacterium]
MDLRNPRIHFSILSLSLAMMAAVTPPRASGQCQVSTNADVIVGELGNNPSNPPHISNFTSAGGIEAFSVGTTSCNIGTFWLNWLQSPNANHPVISQNFFRLRREAAGYNTFEQLGQSWLKHGFFALSENACCNNCSGTDGTHLGVGCSDPYNSTRNASQAGLGPKWQVNATTGVHIHPIANPAWAGTVARRLQIKTPDLAVSDGGQPITSQPRFYVEAQYVAADDAANNNKNNNASYRPIAVSGSDAAWTFTQIGSTQRQQPGIRAWKDFDPTVTETDVIVEEAGGMTALVIVAAQATDLGGGVHHYEYAIQNLNSDRSVRTVKVPVSPYATVTNVGFNDVDYHSGDGSGNITTDGTDWANTVGGGTIQWVVVDVAPADDNALRWGTLYNFRFDCDLPPTTGDLTLGQYKAVNNETASTVVPSDVTCLRGDLNDDTIVDALDIQRFTDRLVGGGATSKEKCAGDLEGTPDFVIDADDMEPFADCVLNEGC